MGKELTGPLPSSYPTGRVAYGIELDEDGPSPVGPTSPEYDMEQEKPTKEVPEANAKNEIRSSISVGRGHFRMISILAGSTVRRPPPTVNPSMSISSTANLHLINLNWMCFFSAFCMKNSKCFLVH